MKKFQLLVLLLLGSIVLHAQSSLSNTSQADFTAGSIVTVDNTTLSGYIKNNMKKNGEVIFLSTDGKKTRYTAPQLSGVTTDTDSFIVANNAFYKIVTDGPKIRLLRKASQSSQIAYNGSEPVAVSAGEGAYNAYFIQTVATRKLQWVRRKDFQKVFTSICADCIPLSNDLKANKISFAEIEQAVSSYNTCAK